MSRQRAASHIQDGSSRIAPGLSSSQMTAWLPRIVRLTTRSLRP